MKKKLIQSISLIGLLLFFACDLFESNPVGTEEITKKGKVSCRIDTTAIPKEVSSIRGFMHNDSSDSVPLINFSILENSAEQIAEDIPVGKWYVNINAFNSNDELRYSGICTTYVYENKVTDLRLNLNKVNEDETGRIDLDVTWEDSASVEEAPDEDSYLLNTNGYTGTMNLGINDNTGLTGNAVIAIDGVTWNESSSRFELTNTSVDISQTWKNETIERIEFSRSDNNQIWHGWESYNGEFYAGYFEGDAAAGEKTHPWVISKNDSSILKKDINDTELNGHYTINGNGYTGWLDITIEGDSVIGSGEFTKDGVTGEETSSPFNIIEGSVKATESWKGRSVKEIVFKRSDIDQTWYGWQTWDGKMIAGYFVDDGSAGGTEFGWYAVKEDSDPVEETPDEDSYLLNANGYTGTMNLGLNDNTGLTGDAVITTDGVTWDETNSGFDLTNTSVDISQTWKNETIERIEFSRSDINQTWHGWGSYNGEFYAGYFEGDAAAGNKISPWVISKNDSSILKKDINDTELNGHYTINGNGYTGWLDITIEGDSVIGSGEFTKDGVTGEETSSPFNIVEGSVDVTESWKGRNIKEIVFKRSDIDQTWYGWQTWDGKMIAGYFVDDGSAGGTEFGWYAVKEE